MRLNVYMFGKDVLDVELRFKRPEPASEPVVVHNGYSDTRDDEDPIEPDTRVKFGFTP